uniref:Uncharacterized protein n=1 Tax=Rhizophora mucronata TaxID=61149 RepID=A0A2P2NJV2_RHIMU
MLDCWSWNCNVLVSPFFFSSLFRVGKWELDCNTLSLRFNELISSILTTQNIRFLTLQNKY